MKLNKIDSEQYRNLRVPEIDWLLNEAQEFFIKSVAFPRVPNYLGFETSQRTIDDIRTIVVENKQLEKDLINSEDRQKVFVLPTDYMFYISAKVTVSKAQCGLKEVRLLIKQHDDKFEESPFDNSSFEWGDINATFDSKGLRVYSDGTFDVENVKLNYIKEPVYIHNASDFKPEGQYKSLKTGLNLTGRQNCELPNQTHREIVDIAVMLASSNLDMQNIQIKQGKLNLNQLN
nr:MAG TPA: hypothetical protein [Caudoviricetes sp.]